MQFSFLAASTLFLSALAAPTPALSNTDLSSLTDKSPLETNGVTDSVESTVTSLEQGSSPITERQAEPLIELLDGLLDTISPIAGEVVDLLAALGGSEAVTESALALVDLEGLLNEIVIEIENVVGNITSGAIPGAEDKDLAGVVGEIVKLVNEVVVKVEGAAGVDAVDQLIVELNTALSGLIDELSGVFDGLLEELNAVLAGLDLKGLDVPELGLL